MNGDVLAKGVVVVEAAATSGSLITATCALEQGREVMAVPGHPFDARASGCNNLIRDGAVLIRSAKDVIEALERPTQKSRKPQPSPLSQPAIPPDVKALHAQILNRIGASPVPEDDVIRDLNIAAQTLLPEIAALEISGEITRDAGGLLRRKS